MQDHTPALVGGIRVPLTQGRFALVDEVDAASVLALTWHASPRRNGLCYARRNVKIGGRWTTQSLHQFLTKWGITDHINGDGLDNRRANLREATHAQNMHNSGPQVGNTSGFKGVRRRAHRTKQWEASIRNGGKWHWLGEYETPEDAARAYDEAARTLHGEYARPNFPH